MLGIIIPSTLFSKILHFKFYLLHLFTFYFLKINSSLIECIHPNYSSHPHTPPISLLPPLFPISRPLLSPLQKRIGQRGQNKYKRTRQKKNHMQAGQGIPIGGKEFQDQAKKFRETWELGRSLGSMKGQEILLTTESFTQKNKGFSK